MSNLPPKPCYSDPRPPFLGSCLQPSLLGLLCPRCKPILLIACWDDLFPLPPKALSSTRAETCLFPLHTSGARPQACDVADTHRCVCSRQPPWEDSAADNTQPRGTPVCPHHEGPATPEPRTARPQPARKGRLRWETEAELLLKPASSRAGETLATAGGHPASGTGLAWTSGPGTQRCL